jgi:hypothetical protein
VPSNRHQTIAWRHDAGHGLVQIGFEAQVAVGDDADDLSPVDHARPEMRCARVMATAPATLVRHRDGLSTPLSKA